MDREAGIERSFMTAFGDEVNAGKAHGFLVSFAKDMGQEAKKGLVATGNKVFREYLESRPDLAGLTDKEVKTEYFKGLLSEARLSAEEAVNSIENPFHTITEPYRVSTHLTQRNAPNDWLLASMHLNASLHSADSFFNAVRRSVSILERPISKAGNAGRVWAGKNPYNPDYIRKLLDIHRVYYNFIKPSAKSKKTPATNLGLAKGTMRFSDILYFYPSCPNK